MSENLEYLNYISISRSTDNFIEIVIQLDGGGSMIQFSTKEDTGADVVRKLRFIADELERGMHERNPPPF